jgi:hypothetical protein
MSGPLQPTRLPPLPRRSHTHPKTHRRVFLIFQFPVEKELEILTIGQGLIIL